MHFAALLTLGLIAGATILLGMPLGRLRSFNQTLRSSLTMFAAGILVFLLVEILGDASSTTVSSLNEPGKVGTGVLLAVLLAAGLAVGLVGLIWFEQRIIGRAAQVSPKRLSFMIATGIGLHNLSEGLAIGQSYASGATALALILIVGFALHNTTEGLGIVGPVVRSGERLSWRTLLLLALIGGGPTFVGTVLGSLWTSPYLSVAVLAMAGGALLYVIMQLLSAARREQKQVVIMSAVVLGFMIGWATEFVADRGLAQSESLSMAHPVTAIVGQAPRRSVSGTTRAAGLDRVNSAAH